MSRLQNLLVYPSELLNEDLSPEAMKHRKFLDNVYDVKNYIAKNWELKRKSVKREILKAAPDFTKNEFENVLRQFGFEAESNPMNKHYVRCMHD